MAGLPHYNNSVASTDKYEPIFQNQFEVLITPPSVITQDIGILVDQVLSIEGLPEFMTTPVTQNYKFAKRSYAGAIPNDTVANLTVKFEVNLNKSNGMYVYNTLRGWSDLIYDPQTGRQGLKKDYCGEIAVVVFNKAGDVFREYKFIPAFVSEPFNALDLNYTNESLYQMTAKFRADQTIDTRVGQITV